MSGMFSSANASVASLANAFFNRKKAPPVVPYTPVDPQEEQKKAVQGNLGALSSIDDLLAQSNAFQQSQASGMMEKALPGYGQFAKNLTATASSLAANPYQVPKSVVDQLTQYAAENNIAGGTGAASGFSESNILRSLGVNALQYGQSNLAAATAALSVLTGTAPRTSPMSPLSFLITPQQQIENQVYTNTQKQRIAQGGANAATAAHNWNTENLWDSLAASVTQSGAAADSFFSTFGIGGKGGGGGGGGGAAALSLMG